MDRTIDEFSKYTPVELLPLIKEMKQDDLFWRQFMVGGEVFSDKEVIEFDSEEMDDGVAMYVSKNGGPNYVGEDGFKTTTHMNPYIYESKTYVPSDLAERDAGETIYSATPKATKLQRKIAKGYMNLNKRFDKTEELQIKQAVETGKINVSGDGVEYLVDFFRDANLTVVNSGSDLWSDTDADKIGQLQELAEVGRGLGYNYDTVILGYAAANKFIADEKIKALLDIRRFDIGEINVSNSVNGKVTYIGHIQVPGLNVRIMSYQGKYKDADRVSQYLLDTNAAVMVESGTKFNMHYGMIQNFKSNNFVGKRFPNTDVASNGKSISITLESSPLFGMTKPNATAIINTEG